MNVMKNGTHLISVLWESVWTQGVGEKSIKPLKALTQQEAMEICADAAFLASLSIAQIEIALKKPIV